MSQLTVRQLSGAEIPQALSLAWEVFRQYEAPDYSPEGTQEFYRSIHDPDYCGRLDVFGAFLDGELAGMIASRNACTHIALFFVKGACHRQGIGRRLMAEIQARNQSGQIAVHSSPYAVPVYHKLGFADTGPEQVSQGIRFTPMEWKLRKC